MTLHRAHQAMGPGREFDTIRMLMERWGDAAADIGDDAAVLVRANNGSQVVTTDACVEGVHFQRAWISPSEVGTRAAAAAISDIAAMGARAESVLIAMIIPDDWKDALGAIADGLGQVVRASGAKIVGGNLSRGNALSITTTVIGSAPRVVSRRGAQVGDVVVVTGVLGGPGAAVTAWNAGGRPAPWARQRFVAPTPRLAEGVALAEAGATAMMDISDGLLADARHMAAAGSVALDLTPASLEVGEGITWQQALSSGEEYELLATIAPDRFSALHAEWSTRFTIPLTVIGSVVETCADGAVRLRENTSERQFSAGSGLRVEIGDGHDHFKR